MCSFLFRFSLLVAAAGSAAPGRIIKSANKITSVCSRNWTGPRPRRNGDDGGIGELLLVPEEYEQPSLASLKSNLLVGGMFLTRSIKKPGHSANCVWFRISLEPFILPIYIYIYIPLLAPSCFYIELCIR